MGERLVFGVNCQPLVVAADGTSVWRPSASLAKVLAANVPDEHKLPPNMGVYIAPIEIAPTKLPPYRMMTVTRVNPSQSPDDTVIASTVGLECKLRSVKIVCVHSATGAAQSITTSKLANMRVCKECAVYWHARRWNEYQLLDARAVCSAHPAMRHRFMLGVVPWPSHNGHGVLRVGAIKMLGTEGLFQIAASGMLAQVHSPAPIPCVAFLASFFKDEAAALAAKCSMPVCEALSWLLQIFGGAAEHPMIMLGTPAERTIADMVLAFQYNVFVRTGNTRIEQPGWCELAHWRDTTVVDEPTAATARIDTEDDVQTTVAAIEDHIAASQVLELTVGTDRITATHICRIIRVHPLTRIVLGCWHPLHYLLHV